MAVTITSGLNWFYEFGGFDYVIPFLLIFAVVFAIIEKSKIFKKDDEQNKVIPAIVAASIGLLAIQFGFVS